MSQLEDDKCEKIMFWRDEKCMCVAQGRTYHTIQNISIRNVYTKLENNCYNPVKKNLLKC